jgi:hypothetical protein
MPDPFPVACHFRDKIVADGSVRKNKKEERLMVIQSASHETRSLHQVIVR